MKLSGPLFDCAGCSMCNLCKYKKLADKNDLSKQVMEMPENAKKAFIEKRDKSLNKIYNVNRTEDERDFDETVKFKVKDLRSKDEEFYAKFGILKKASVLMFYGRANDAFDTIAKAADIIKKAHEREKENEVNVQKRWQFKLGLPEGIEVPNIEKITEE